MGGEGKEGTDLMPGHHGTPDPPELVTNQPEGGQPPGAKGPEYIFILKINLILLKTFVTIWAAAATI
jgi:hypothetical protein